MAGMFSSGTPAASGAQAPADSSSAANMQQYATAAGQLAGIGAQVSQYQHRAMPVYGPDGKIQAIPQNGVQASLQSYLNSRGTQLPAAASMPGASLDIPSYQPSPTLVQTLQAFANRAGKR